MKLKQIFNFEALKRGIVKVGRRNWIILGALVLLNV